MSLKWSSACHYLASLTVMKTMCLHLMNKAVTFPGFFCIFSLIKSSKIFFPTAKLQQSCSVVIHSWNRTDSSVTNFSCLWEELHFNQLAEKNFDVEACYYHSPKLKNRLVCHSTVWYLINFWRYLGIVFNESFQNSVRENFIQILLCLGEVQFVRILSWSWDAVTFRLHQMF